MLVSNLSKLDFLGEKGDSRPTIFAVTIHINETWPGGVRSSDLSFAPREKSDLAWQRRDRPRESK